MTTGKVSTIVTTYQDIQVNGQPVVYDGPTGQVLIDGHALDGHLLIELAQRVTKARQRDGHDPVPVASREFIALHMTEAEILNADAEIKWESLLMHYADRWGKGSPRYMRAERAIAALRAKLDREGSMNGSKG